MAESSHSHPADKQRAFDPLVFWVSASITVIFVLWAAIFPQTMESVVYAMLTIPLAHACFTKNLPFRFSSAFYYVLGDRIHGTWGKVLDIFAVFATLGGLATTTGLIALQLSSGFKYQYGLELPTWGAYLIIGVLTAVFTLAVYTGLEKGIKWIGKVNMGLFVAVWFFVLLFGPTLFVINLTTNSFGQYLLHFVPMSLYTAPGVEGNWLGSWTIIYWAWWGRGRDQLGLCAESGRYVPGSTRPGDPATRHQDPGCAGNLRAVRRKACTRRVPM